MSHIQKEVTRLQKEGMSPESEEAQNIAKAVWEMMFEITNGDEELLLKFSESIERLRGFDEASFGKHKESFDYLQSAINAYFKNVEQKSSSYAINEKMKEHTNEEGRGSDDE